MYDDRKDSSVIRIFIIVLDLDKRGQARYRSGYEFDSPSVILDYLLLLFGIIVPLVGGS